MAFYNKYAKEQQGRGQGYGGSRREPAQSRGGYHGAANTGRGGQGLSQRGQEPRQRRFGPGAEGQEARRREYLGPDRKQQGFGRPAVPPKRFGPAADPEHGFGRPVAPRQRFGRPAGPRQEQKPAGPRFHAAPQGGADRQMPAPGRRPQQRPFGRPMTPPPARPFGRPAPVSMPEQKALPLHAAENPPEDNILVGRNPIREAIKTGRDMEKLLVASGELSGSAREIVAMARTAGVKVQVVDRSRLDQITHHHQGMIAYASAYAYSSLEDILAVAEERGEASFIIILDKVTDPQNLGAIIRTAACVGAHGVLVQLHRAVGLTPSAVRASAGAVEHVKVARVVNINNSIRSLKQKGVFIYAADTSGRDYREVKIGGPCALVIGSEGEGISPLTLSLCDEKLSIPMTGAIGSLNASVAAGILIYAAYSGRSA